MGQDLVGGVVWTRRISSRSNELQIETRFEFEDETTYRVRSKLQLRFV